MKKILATSSIVLLSLHPLTANAINKTSHEATYLLRISSNDSPQQNIPFNATYMVITNKGAKIATIKQTTPYESTINANFIGVMLEIDSNRPNIKMDIAEVINHQDNIKLSGTGHTIFAHHSTSGNSYILAQ